MNRHRLAKKLINPAFVASAWLSTAVIADVVFDGSIGPNAAGTTRAADFFINEVDGVRAGQNLFHSFDQFSVLSGESATFTHSSAAVNNIIARVTGNVTTEISGLLRTRFDSGAGLSPSDVSLWLLNPAGFTINDGAILDVTGALNLGATNRIGFINDEDFYSHDVTTTSILSVAEPTSFGFLDKGSSLPAEFSEGFTPSGTIELRLFDPLALDNPLAVGELTLVGAVRLAEFSDVRFAGVSLSGDVFDPLASLDPQNPFDFSDGSALNAQRLRIASLGTDFDGSGSSIDLSLEGLEAVTGKLSDISIFGNLITIGSTGGAGTDTAAFEIYARNLAVSESMILVGSPARPNVNLVWNTESDISLSQSPIFSAGGGLAFTAPKFNIDGGSGRFSYLESINAQTSNAEPIVINTTGSLDFNNLLLSSRTSGSGDGADIIITANTYEQASGRILTTTSSLGDGGDIELLIGNGRNLLGDAATLTQGAQMILSTTGSGDAGSLSFTAEGPIGFDGSSSTRQFLQSFSSGINAGSTGNLMIQGTEVSLTETLINTVSRGGDDLSPARLIRVASTEGDLVVENSLIGSSTFGNQAASDVTLDAAAQLLVLGQIVRDDLPGSPVLNAVQSRSDPIGGANGISGSVILTGATVTLVETAINNATSSNNRAGQRPSISIIARDGSVETISTDILSFTSGDTDAGNITIDASDDVQIVANDSGSNIASNNSDLDAMTVGAAGNITISGNDIRLIRESEFFPPGDVLGTRICPSMCTTSLNQGDGGNISINARGQLFMEGSYSLIASAEGTSDSSANAGSISLSGQDILFETSTDLEQVRNRSQITTSTETRGDAGRIEISAVDTLRINGQYDISSQSGDTSNPTLIANAGSAGSISLAANRIYVNSIVSNISTGTVTGGDAGNISISSDSDLSLRGVLVSSASDRMATDAGSAGRVDISGDAVRLDQVLISSETVSNNRDNSAASIRITASGALDLTNSSVTAQTSGLADAGNISLDANGALVLRNTSVSSPTLNTDSSMAALGELKAGSGGTVRLGANSSISQLSILGNSVITTQTEGSGEAGDVVISTAGDIQLGGDPGVIEERIIGLAEDITIDGMPADLNLVLDFLPFTPGQLSDSALISSTSESQGMVAGSAGSVLINGVNLALDNGQISALSQSGNDANTVGNIGITLSKQLSLSGAAAKILAGSTGAVKGGDISIDSDDLVATMSAEITTSASGSANAGNININTRQLLLQNGALFETSAVEGGGGNVNILTSGSFSLVDAQILASSNASTAEGDGGTINIGSMEAPVNRLILQGSMGASANAGDGGQINIFADVLLRDVQSQLLVTSQSGNAGSLAITAPDQDISAAIAELNVGLLDAASLIQDNCANTDSLQDSSSLKIGGQGGLQGAPDHYLSSYQSLSLDRTAMIIGSGDKPLLAVWTPAKPTMLLGKAAGCEMNQAF